MSLCAQFSIRQFSIPTRSDLKTVPKVARRIGGDMELVPRGAHSPPFQGGEAAPLVKRSRSSAAQTGWLVISNKIRSATRSFTNHPVCAAKDASQHLLIAQPPLLKNEEEWHTI